MPPDLRAVLFRHLQAAANAYRQGLPPPRTRYCGPDGGPRQHPAVKRGAARRRMAARAGGMPTFARARLGVTLSGPFPRVRRRKRPSVPPGAANSVARGAALVVGHTSGLRFCPGGAPECSHGWSAVRRRSDQAQPVVSFGITPPTAESPANRFGNRTCIDITGPSRFAAAPSTSRRRPAPAGAAR